MAVHSALLYRTTCGNRLLRSLCRGLACKVRKAQYSRCQLSVGPGGTAPQLSPDLSQAVAKYEDLGCLRRTYRLSGQPGLVSSKSKRCTRENAAVPTSLKHCRCQELDKYSEDCLIVAGDISDNLQTFKTTLLCFKEKFKVVHQVQYMSP